MAPPRRFQALHLSFIFFGNIPVEALKYHRRRLCCCSPLRSRAWRGGSPHVLILCWGSTSIRGRAERGVGIRFLGAVGQAYTCDAQCCRDGTMLLQVQRQYHIEEAMALFRFPPPPCFFRNSSLCSNTLSPSMIAERDRCGIPKLRNPFYT